jgi:hypothetical protein
MRINFAASILKHFEFRLSAVGEETPREQENQGKNAGPGTAESRNLGFLVYTSSVNSSFIFTRLAKNGYRG